MVWLPDEHLAFAALDGRDAAPVCVVSLGVAQRFGAGNAGNEALTVGSLQVAN